MTTQNTPPALLAFAGSVRPSHMLLYSAPACGSPASELVPLSVRYEPLRGLNATSKTKEDEKSKPILAVVESAELAPGHSVLVLVGTIKVLKQAFMPQSCDKPQFFKRHAAAMESAVAAGDFAMLAQRYALTIAMGGWTWRNGLEAETQMVQVSWRERLANGTRQERRVVFDDLLPAEADLFDFNQPEYAPYKDDLQLLANAIERALVSKSVRCLLLEVRADVVMGLGSRVYPSQEWASEQSKRESKENWPGGDGLARILAKLKTPAGGLQAIINERKVGNALRTIDTWYPGGSPNTPIPTEAYGANAHLRVVHRSGAESVFGAVRAVDANAALTPDQRLYYTAMTLRGGVFGSKEA